MQFLKHRISNTNLLSTLVRSAVVSLEVRGLGPNGTKQITCMQCVGGGEGTAWEGEETRPTKEYEDTNLQFILLKCRQISAQLNLKKRLLKKDHKLPNFNVTVSHFKDIPRTQPVIPYNAITMIKCRIFPPN